MTSDQTRRVLVHCYGPELDPVRNGLGIVLRFVAENPKVRDLAVYVPTLHNMEGTTISTVLDELGSRLSGSLRKGRAVHISPAASLRLLTERTIHQRGIAEVVFAVYAHDKMLEKAELYRSAKLIVAVPWHHERVQEWRDGYQPEELGEERQVPPTH